VPIKAIMFTDVFGGSGGGAGGATAAGAAMTSPAAATITTLRDTGRAVFFEEGGRGWRLIFGGLE
jgi:hypothetical protein